METACTCMPNFASKGRGCFLRAQIVLVWAQLYCYLLLVTSDSTSSLESELFPSNPTVIYPSSELNQLPEQSYDSSLDTTIVTYFPSYTESSEVLLSSISSLNVKSANTVTANLSKNLESIHLNGHVHTSTLAELNTASDELIDPFTFVRTSPIWDVLDTLTLETREFWVTENVEISATASVLADFSVGQLFDMNSTRSSSHLHSSEVETSSTVWSSSSAISPPGPTSGNASCDEKDAGCVKYRGEDEEEVRIKVIVGIACGAVLLLVVLGIIIGCLLKRRGKMSSGSKIDLSSYWDDNVTLSYINGHIDIPKDSADEMISLDNDSFLNSLDSMSFSNTWTSDSSKHTNF